MSLQQFCPRCDSLFRYSNQDEQLVLKCDNCDYVEANRKKIEIDLNTKVSSSSGTITEDIIYDPALLRTSKILCGNTSCPSLNPDNWKEDGTNFPELILQKKNDKDYSMLAICRWCKTICELNSLDA